MRRRFDAAYEHAMTKIAEGLDFDALNKFLDEEEAWTKKSRAERAAGMAEYNRRSEAFAKRMGFSSRDELNKVWDSEGPKGVLRRAGIDPESWDTSGRRVVDDYKTQQRGLRALTSGIDAQGAELGKQLAKSSKGGLGTAAAIGIGLGVPTGIGIAAYNWHKSRKSK